jgi:hypothetical protein
MHLESLNEISITSSEPQDIRRMVGLKEFRFDNFSKVVKSYALVERDLD